MNYKGDKILNTVTDFHGNISTVIDTAAELGLGLFEMCELRRIDNIDLRLTSDVYLPKLNSTDPHHRCLDNVLIHLALCGQA